MSAALPPGADEAKRRALHVLTTLVADAKTGHVPFADFKAALGELRDLDPETQRRIARAMRESGGDPAALRAALDAAPPGESRHRTSAKTASRPPTVVDARGGIPWRGVAIAVAAAALTVAVLAGFGPDQ